MTGVRAAAGRFREALAELPLSTRSVEGVGGAIVVVPGDGGWVDAAFDAASAGAVAVIVDRPAFAPAEDLRRLQEAVGVPMVIDRALLRPDSTADAAAGRLTDGGWAAPRLLVADGNAPPGLFPVVAREAVGWLRILAGDDLELVAADGELALLETPGGIAATLSVVATLRSGGGSIRVHALGEVRTEIEVGRDHVRVRTSTVGGSMTAPDRFESSARVAVRRALTALDAGHLPNDLSELAADAALVEQILSSSP
jgi:hypothetical protein